MKNAITTVPQAKTAVSALRRELKALSKSSDAFSHSECLELMAKALGFSSWNAWQATLEAGATPVSTDTPEPATSRPKYPLTNNGEYDFIKPGEYGIPLQGDFEPLENTLERVEAKAYVRSACRTIDPMNPGIGGSGLDVEHSGSETFDDTMETETKDGRIVWVSDDGVDYDGVVILTSLKHPHPQYDEKLPVRAKLLEAYLEYYAEHGVDDSAKEGGFEKAEATLGIWLTEREGEHLLDQLREKGLA